MGLSGTQRPNFQTPQPQASETPAAPSPQVDGLGDALLQQGAAETAGVSREVAQSVVQSIKKEGLFGNNLKSTIAKVQLEAGLGQTGKLDAPTVRYMQSRGWIPEMAGKVETPKDAKQAEEAKNDPAQKKDATKAKKGKGDVKADAGKKGQGPTVKVGKNNVPKAPPGTKGGVGAAPGRPSQTLQGKAPANMHRVPGEASNKMNPGLAPGAKQIQANQQQNQKAFGELLQWLTNLGFLGGKRGDQASDAIKKPLDNKAPPTAQKVQPDADPANRARQVAETATSSASPQEGGGSGQGAGAEAKVDAKTASSQNNVKEAQASDANKAGQTPQADMAKEKARTSSDRANQDPNMRGTAKGDPQATAGRAADGQGAAVKKGKGGSGAGQLEGMDGAFDEGEVDGTEGVDANSDAGDEDVDADGRGHANVHGDGEHEEGYYEIGALSGQIVEALETIERDDDGTGPATYCWDVTFHRPGVYGAFQPAQPLWHIGIEKVTAFDPVWEQARDVLTKRLRQVEPDALPPGASDFENALRRARVRDARVPLVDTSAATAEGEPV